MGMKNNSTPERFRNRKEALTWLQNRGQISQGKFYTDCTAGLLTIYPDKSMSKFQVAEYAVKVFGFARQEPLQKTIKRINHRTLSPSAGLLDDGQGVTMGINTKGAEAMNNKSGIEDVHVSLKFNKPDHELDDQEQGRGTIRMTAALGLSFTGDIQSMAGGLQNITQELITGAITGALVELLGDGIMIGGCHVQD